MGSHSLYKYSPWRAFALNNRLRAWFLKPTKLLKDYVKEGMTVIDVGSGSGMFTIAMAKMVGRSGKVIAVDVQDEMLETVRQRSEREGIRSRINLHKGTPDSLGLCERADFILAFHVVHEVPDQEKLLKEVITLLKPRAKVLIVEPTMRVSALEFENLVDCVQSLGLKLLKRPMIWLSHTGLFESSEK